MKEILGSGAIAKTSVPEGWFDKVNQPDPLAMGWTKSLSLRSDPTTEIVFYNRGEPIDADTAKFFMNLLSEKSASSGDEKLTPVELLHLQTLMGFESTGNNQYTNSNSAASGYGPAFDVQEACTKRINNRTVLYIKGMFANGKHYAGVFYPADSSGQNIEEVMIQAPSARKMKDNYYHFQHLIDNIEWNVLSLSG